MIIVFLGRHFNKFLSRMFCLLQSYGWNIADMTYNTKESVWSKLAEWILRVVNLFWLLSLPEGGHDPLLSALTNNLCQVEIDLKFIWEKDYLPYVQESAILYWQKIRYPFPKHAFCQVWLNLPSGSRKEDENVKGLQTDRQTVHNQGLLICISFQLWWPKRKIFRENVYRKGSWTEVWLLLINKMCIRTISIRLCPREKCPYGNFLDFFFFFFW